MTKQLVIQLNSSESLVFWGLFGLFFTFPNYYKILIKKIFPIIIETSTPNLVLFKVLYFLSLAFITYKSYHWIIKLGKNIEKTGRLYNVNFKFYIVRIIFFGFLGIILAIILNNLLF